ncbi:sugar ABC transporter ATP-binding protein [Aeromicrobium sp. Leaf350]|uniref:sugar ABC transporter ATP-binding protein n=1 Tax=Aeromicrobium sp. Leaf350 TaxID=2876565 RepID=UPI001E43BF5D|nr:sugar ABC transporter ATP-binding protein [Aeromicrobium sp. Leaf350]
MSTSTYEPDGGSVRRGSSDEDPSALRLEGVGKSFSGTPVLSDVSLNVRQGEVHALIGQNGSGKSTLIKILSGFHHPDPGSRATVLDVALELGDPGSAHQRGIRFVHQDLGLVGRLSSLENFALGIGYPTGALSRIRWRQHRQIVRDGVRRLGHEFDLAVPVERLAPVERTALAIARALHGADNLSLLVLDEPTATMPRADVERLHHLVRRVSGEGIGVLYVSHHLDEIMSLADRVTVLRDGRKVDTAEIQTVTKENLITMMTGSTVNKDRTAAAGTTTAGVVLEVRDLSFGSSGPISFDVRGGEILGIAGITGSGRERLCRTVYGGSDYDGTVLIEGTPLKRRNTQHAVTSGVGFVSATRLDDGVVAEMSVRENLMLGDIRSVARFGVVRRSRESAECADLFRDLKVKASGPEAPLASLSGGNQQKVVIGRWLRRRPRVLLLDEPTQGVDVAAKADIHRLVDDAATTGVAVVVAGSDEEELVRLCDRILVMRDGVVARQFARGEITASELAFECLADDKSDQKEDEHA